MKRAAAAFALLLAACAPAPPGSGSKADAGEHGGRTTGPRRAAIRASHTTRRSPTSRRQNVGTLGLAWSVDLGTNRVLEATPVVIGGVMYTSGVAGRAYAFDAATGKELWRFEPQVDMQVNRAVCCDMANRGVAVARGKVFVSALDGWMYALDARSGQVVWKSDAVVDRNRGYSSTGAPEVAGDVVVIGNAGAEYDTRGYVSAFDLETGELRWRFWVVPRDPRLGPQDHPDLERAIETWDPDSRWDVGGGGAPWDAINYDAETGLVLVGTGNGGPYHTVKRSPKGGDQLYLASIVALDANTGRLKWFYQQTPGDNWDFTSTQPMILTRMVIDGERRPVVIHAPKNGFLYILDRRDGKLLRANPIVRTNWATSVDLKTGRPAMDPRRGRLRPGAEDRVSRHTGSAQLAPGQLRCSKRPLLRLGPGHGEPHLHHAREETLRPPNAEQRRGADLRYGPRGGAAHVAAAAAGGGEGAARIRGSEARAVSSRSCAPSIRSRERRTGPRPCRVGRTAAACSRRRAVSCFWAASTVTSTCSTSATAGG